MTETAGSAVEIIRARAGHEPIEYAFVLGAGLGSVFEGAENEISIPYAELPGFPQLTSSAHEGRLAIGTQDGVRVAYMLGRAHYFETGDPRCMAAPLETLALLGTRQIVLTGSAGSAKADLYPSSIAILTDHINLCGINPLVGIASDGGFISLTETS